MQVINEIDINPDNIPKIVPYFSTLNRLGEPLQGIVAGWGSTSDYKKGSDNIECSGILRSLTVDILMKKKCEKLLDAHETILRDDILCGLTEEDGSGICLVLE